MQEGNFVSNETATGYSVDNIAPSTLSTFSGAFVSGNAELSWDPSTANDLSHYNIYRNSQFFCIRGYLFINFII